MNSPGYLLTTHCFNERRTNRTAKRDPRSEPKVP
jgi:hypothetical protein